MSRAPGRSWLLSKLTRMEVNAYLDLLEAGLL